jgi:hypothetical protein
MKHHTLIWFVDRIGKRIYRLTQHTCCNICDEAYRNGLIIHDRQHAEYLYLNQCEAEAMYGDEKEVSA